MAFAFAFPAFCRAVDFVLILLGVFIGAFHGVS